jgi:hypothetical protein
MVVAVPLRRVILMMEMNNEMRFVVDVDDGLLNEF